MVNAFLILNDTNNELGVRGALRDMAEEKWQV